MSSADAQPAAVVWTRPSYPEQVVDEQRLVVVEDAVVSRFRVGDLRAFVVPDRRWT